MQRWLPSSHLWKPLCLWRGRLKPVMLLKPFIFHVQCSAHRERGILAVYYGMEGRCSAAASSICEPERSAALIGFLLSVVSLLTHTHTGKNTQKKTCPVLHTRSHTQTHTHTLKRTIANFKPCYFTPVWGLRTS